jgi:hypothetical protein
VINLSWNSAGSGFESLAAHKTAGQQVSNASPERTMGCEDSAPLAGCGWLRVRRMLVGFVVVDPESSVVPVSL